jgi:DNA-binding MarR family transcriptional regulator
VKLTTDGRNAVDAALTDLLERERILLAGISKADRTQLADVLRKIVLPFDQVAVTEFNDE